MQKNRPLLVSLDPLRGFEAAARLLSFTRAAGELHLTQSAVSRQIKALEERLGVALFERRHRALLLTAAGQRFQRTVSEALAQLESAARALRGAAGARTLTVSTTISFASLWLVPRLPDFRKHHGDIDVRISAANEIVDLAREGIDVAVRYCLPQAAPRGALRLVGEQIFPVCSRALLRDAARPLKEPPHLARQVLLHLEDPNAMPAAIDWATWLEANGLAELKPRGTLRFSHYDQLIQAAVAGQGVALGRDPLIRELLRAGKLAAPFRERRASTRAYFVIESSDPAAAAERKAFVDWLLDASKPRRTARKAPAGG